jgi:TRAP-type uncharacterized transport system substrate-binding protein
MRGAPLMVGLLVRRDSPIRSIHEIRGKRLTGEYPAHPVFKEWTQERAASADVTIPYHPAAARFYRERGVWKPEMEEAQRRLLSASPR